MFWVMALVVGCSSGNGLRVGDAGSDGAAATDTSITSAGDGGEDNAPQLSVSPSQVTFSLVDVGSKSPPPMPTVTVTNTGGVTASLAPKITGGDFAIESTTCGQRLPPGATCSITLYFAPAAPGSASGTLSVAEGIAISLTGTGVAEGPEGICTDRVDLGAVVVGTAAPVAIHCVSSGTVTDFACVAAGNDLVAEPASTTCGAVLAAGSPCVVAFLFKSDIPGPKSDVVVCSRAGGGPSIKIPVTATVVTLPSLSIHPTVAVMTAVIGDVATQVFEVTNLGGSASGPLKASLSPDPSEFSIVANGCAAPLAPLASCVVTVAFARATPGTKSADLNVSDTLAPATFAAAIIAGASVGNPDGPVISGNPDFGSVLVGTSSAPSVFTLRNAGGQATSIISISSTDPAQFTIGNDTCSGQLIAAFTGSCTFTVTFAPAATAASGVLTASVQVLAEGRNQSILSIRGTAIKPATLTVTPAELSFDGVALTWQSEEKLLTISNTGEVSTGKLTAPQDPGTGFVISSNGCTTALDPKQSCTIGIKFTPAAIAEVDATFTLTSASGAIGRAKLIGSGRMPPPLEIVPSDVRACGEIASADGGTGAGPCFADTTVGAIGAPVSFTVTYVAPGYVSIPTGELTMNLGGANVSDFVIAGSDCGPSLVPMQHCTFTINLRPKAPGLRKATVEVTSLNGGRTSATLEAIGLAVDGGAS